VRREDGYFGHPLSIRASNSAIAFWKKCDELGLEKLEDPDLDELINEYHTTSIKLAGALDSLGYGRGLSEGAFLVAYLKRALSHLHAAQAALEKVAPKNLLSADLLSMTRTELFALREGILALMTEFRVEP